MCDTMYACGRHCRQLRVNLVDLRKYIKFIFHVSICHGGRVFHKRFFSRMALQLEDAVWSSILATEVVSKMTNPSQLRGCCPSADPDLWPQVFYKDQLISNVKSTLYFKNSKCPKCINCMDDTLTEQKAKKYINILNKKEVTEIISPLRRFIILLMKNWSPVL